MRGSKPKKTRYHRLRLSVIERRLSRLARANAAGGREGEENRVMACGVDRMSQGDLTRLHDFCKKIHSAHEDVYRRAYECHEKAGWAESVRNQWRSLAKSKFSTFASVRAVPSCMRLSIWSVCSGAIKGYWTKRLQVERELFGGGGKEGFLQENKKNFEKSVEFAQRHQLHVPQNLLLPPICKPVTPGAVKEYNKAAGKIRQWQNRVLWQAGVASQKEAPPVEKIKGWPSFPGISVSHPGGNLQTAAQTLLDFVNGLSQQAQSWFGQLNGAAYEALKEEWSPHFEIHPRGERGRNYLNPENRTHYFIQALMKRQPGISAAALHEKVEKFLRDRSDRLWRHLQNQAGRTDRRAWSLFERWLSLRAKWYWAPLLASGRQQEAWPHISRFTDLHGDFRGALTVLPERDIQASIAGFSVSGGIPQYGAALAYREVKVNGQRKRKWAILLNLGKRRSWGVNSSTSGRKKSGPTSPLWTCFIKSGGGRTGEPSRTKPVPLWIHKPSDILAVPLALGRRQADRFLRSMELGKAQLSNARIVGHGGDTGGPDRWEVHVTFQWQRKIPESGAFPRPDCLLGIDRGERHLAYLAIVNGEGCLLESRPLVPEHSQIQRHLQKRISSDQREKGMPPIALRRKRQNVARTAVYEAVAHLLDVFIQKGGRAPLVLEALPRGFGRRGPKVLMSLQQYTRLLDRLRQILGRHGFCNPSPKVKRWDNGALQQVSAAWTSLTCWSCGRVNDREAMDEIFTQHLQRSGTGWSLAVNGFEHNLSDMQKKKLNELWPSQYSSFGQLPKRRQSHLLAWANRNIGPNLESGRFHCLFCGFEEERDKVAAANIARKWIYERGRSQKTPGRSPNKTASSNKKRSWEMWYRTNLNKWNSPPSPPGRS